jgi:H+/Cl- antiporter ClcA
MPCKVPYGGAANKFLENKLRRHREMRKLLCVAAAIAGIAGPS